MHSRVHALHLFSFPLINIVASVTLIEHASWSRQSPSKATIIKSDVSSYQAVYMPISIMCDRGISVSRVWIKRNRINCCCNDRQVAKLNIDINYARCKYQRAVHSICMVKSAPKLFFIQCIEVNIGHVYPDIPYRIWVSFIFDLCTLSRLNGSFIARSGCTHLSVSDNSGLNSVFLRKVQLSLREILRFNYNICSNNFNNYLNPIFCVHLW